MIPDATDEQRPQVAAAQHEAKHDISVPFVYALLIGSGIYESPVEWLWR